MKENIKFCAIEYCFHCNIIYFTFLPLYLKKKNLSTTTYCKAYKNEFMTEKISFNKDAIF